MICLECSQQYNDELVFNKHLRSHKLSIAYYWQKHFPRYDLYDKKLIDFKSKEYYFETNFRDRKNLSGWLKIATTEQQKEYIIDFLNKRKKNKKLTYSLTQAEIKTLMIPGIKYINNLFGDYHKLCSDLGFTNRFVSYFFDKSKFINISKKVIFRDTREQSPLDFNVQTRNKCMNVGDYRLANSDIRVERKSVSDFWQTMTTGYDRFVKEIGRAKEQKLYLVVLVEGTLEDVHQFPLQSKLYGKIKMSSERPLYNMRKLLAEHKDIQFVFVEGRKEASRIIEVLFSADKQCKEVDIQYLIDVKEI